MDAYTAALAQGLTDEAAWREGVEVFALHHPSWPRPLAEREAARAAGGLVLLDRVQAASGLLTVPRTTPKALLAALASPVHPTSPITRRQLRLPPCPMELCWNLGDAVIRRRVVLAYE
ncbi:MAG TPA: hypothetical protein VGN83_18415 [Falsiroseomonas sp.]|nr:hypothetical protein [Falsiroseomonas sp.]